MAPTNQTALVTGANSGLGFETSAQLANAGYGRIILACRTEEKAATARDNLIKKTGQDVFEILAVDVSEFESSLNAAKLLTGQPGNIDLLVLNAGVGPQTLKRTSNGIELILATTLFGHHILTMKLLEAGKLSPHAHIVIAGSEAARGTAPMPGMSDMLYDYDFLQSAAGGDLAAAMDAVARGDQPAFNFNNVYSNSKIWVAWWVAVLARKLPQGMVVVAMSPGSNPGTSFGRDMPAIMRLLMLPIMRVVGPWFKMAGPLAVGAKRYLDASEFGPEASGQFWASPPRVLVGPIEVQSEAHLYDLDLQTAAWSSLVRLTGVGLSKSADADPK